MRTSPPGHQPRDFIRLIFEQVPGLVWATDRELRITHAYGRTAALQDPDFERLMGTTVYDFIGSEDPSEPAIAHHLAALAGRSQSFQYLRHHRWFEAHIEPLRGKTRDIIGCVGVAVDVTERRESQDRLARSEAHLSATLEATADGILVVDRHGRVTMCNRRFLTLWDIPPSLAERRDEKALLSYVQPQLEDPAAFVDAVRDLYASVDHRYHLLTFKDGRVFERYSMPQRVGDAVVGRVWSFRDVTLRERLLRRATFLSDAARVLSSLDVRTALQAVAQLAVPFLGERCAIHLIEDGRDEWLFVAGSAAHAPAPEVHASARAGHPVVYAAGSRSHLAVPFLCRDTVAGVLTCVAPAGRRYTNDDLELTEELARRAALSIDNARLYEGARQAVSRRDELMSIAAHEIRGPLTAMHLAVQSLRRGTLSSAAADTALDTIEREDRRLARFVDELLDLSRIRTGQLRFTLEEVDIGSVVREVVSRHAGDVARSGSSIRVTTDGNLMGEWDRFRLDQVIANLLSNAIKFGQGRPIEIAAVESDGRVTLTVSDHGIGIEPSMLTKIFDPFQRAVASRHYGGLGLGLHIVETIVEGLGGTIGVDSRPGAGATFVVELPTPRSAIHERRADPGR